MSALELFDPSFVPLASEWLVTYLSEKTSYSPCPTDFRLVIARQSANGDFQGRAEEDAQILGRVREGRVRFLRQCDAVATEAPVYHEGLLSDDGATLTGVWAVSGSAKLSGTWQARAIVSDGQSPPVWPPPPEQPEAHTTPLPTPPRFYVVSRAAGTCLLITTHPQEQSLVSAWLSVLMLTALFAFMLVAWGRFAFDGGIFQWGPIVSLGALVVYGVVSTVRRRNAVRYGNGFYFDRATGQFGRQAKPLGNLSHIRGVEVQPGPTEQEVVFLVLQDEAPAAVAFGTPDNMAQIAEAIRRFLSAQA